jgi:hypothetical protein
MYLNWSMDMKCFPSKLFTLFAKVDANLFATSLLTTVCTDLTAAVLARNMLSTWDLMGFWLFSVLMRQNKQKQKLVY